SVSRGFTDRWLGELNAVTTTTAALELGDLLRIALHNPLNFLERESAATAGALSSTTFGFVWLFLAGGIIDRYARDRATRSHGFFQACGVFFFRFLRLGVVLLAADVIISRFVPRPFAANVVLAACGFIVDYAVVRSVVEDRRSVLGALRAGLAFIGRNPVAAVSLYAIQYAMFAAIAALYVAAGPSSAISWTRPGLIVVNQ